MIAFIGIVMNILGIIKNVIKYLPNEQTVRYLL